MLTIFDLPADTNASVDGTLRKDMIANINKARNYPGKKGGRLDLMIATLEVGLNELQEIKSKLQGDSDASIETVAPENNAPNDSTNPLDIFD